MVMLQLCPVSFHTTKLCSRLYSIEIEFYLKKTKNLFLSHPLGDLVVTYALHLQLVRKPMVDFLFLTIELFRYLLRHKRKSVEVAFFEGGGSL